MNNHCHFTLLVCYSSSFFSNCQWKKIQHNGNERGNVLTNLNSCTYEKQRTLSFFFEILKMSVSSLLKLQMLVQSTAKLFQHIKRTQAHPKRQEEVSFLHFTNEKRGPQWIVMLFYFVDCQKKNKYAKEMNEVVDTLGIIILWIICTMLVAALMEMKSFGDVWRGNQLWSKQSMIDGESILTKLKYLVGAI